MTAPDTTTVLTALGDLKTTVMERLAVIETLQRTEAQRLGHHIKEDEERFAKVNHHLERLVVEAMATEKAAAERAKQAEARAMRIGAGVACFSVVFIELVFRYFLS